MWGVIVLLGVFGLMMTAWVYMSATIEIDEWDDAND